MRLISTVSIRLAAMLLCAFCAAGPLAAQGLKASERPAALQNVGIDQLLGAQAPLDAAFSDEDGRRVRLGDYFGERPVVMVLAYYECPMLCTEVLNGVLRAIRTMQFEVGNEFDIVTVSIDPGETPRMAADKKAVYLERYGREGGASGWHFLTGPEESIRPLADAVGFRYQYEAESDLYSHASAIMVLTPGGRVSRYLFGVEYSPRDLRLSLVEAAGGGIGSAVDQVLLYCFRYDPSLGRYSLVIMNVLRLAALATMVGIGGLLLWLRLGERARRAAAS